MNIYLKNFFLDFQNSTSTGVFERFYQETLNNLRSYNFESIPTFFLSDYKSYFFVNFFRTSTLPPKLNYFNMNPHEIKLPVLRNSQCRLRFEFSEYLDCNDDLLVLNVMSITPSFIKIKNNRQITLSYFPNWFFVSFQN